MEAIESSQLDLPDAGRTSRCGEQAEQMHLLIIILQQLLGLLPSGEGKKAPQVELARPPRPSPHGSDPSPCLGLEFPRDDWMMMVPVVHRVGVAYWSRFRPPRLGALALLSRSRFWRCRATSRDG